MKNKKRLMKKKKRVVVKKINIKKKKPFVIKIKTQAKWLKKSKDKCKY